MNDVSALNAIEFPDADARRRLASLVGIDPLKDRLAKSIALVIDNSILDKWTKTANKGHDGLARHFRGRQPLFILCGDVGTGKTELAETIGDRVAREAGLPITLFRMSLSSRGSGLVGEMTKLITAAFSGVAATAAKWKTTSGKARAGAILFIDEADALAQSREASEMHHEDRAGVNALIRGIDEVTRAQLPVAVLMATNRLPSIDPAVRRRAADVLEFGRPGDEQRLQILSEALGHALKEAEIQQLVKSTGRQASPPGFTYSDLTQRLLPMVLLAALPDRPLTFDLVQNVLKHVHPTPVFKDAGI